MSFFRRIVILGASAVLLGLPAPAQGQLAVSASCYPGISFPCSFELSQVAAARPIELAFLQVDLLGTWAFASEEASGTDLFGPLPPLAASYGASASTLVVDFLTPLNGPGACFPYDPFSCPFLTGFAVGTEFTPPTFVDMELLPPGFATTGDVPEFAWEATDIDGTIYRGGGTSVVPEPSTYVLLATGLVLLGFIHRRRTLAEEARDEAREAA